MPYSTPTLASPATEAVWHQQSEDQLRAYAAQYVGYATDDMGDPENLTFTLEQQFPVIEFHSLRVDWQAYYRDDVKDDARYPDFQSKEGDPYHTPIILSFEMDELILWDGYHRIATAIYRGDETILAIVGREKR